MTEFWTWIEMLPLAARIGESWWFPLLESIHVLTAMFVVGTIVFVDLRLLGIAATQYVLTTFVREMVRWSWAAFVLAFITGLGMFMTRASWYVLNTAFQVKLALLVIAGFNMLAFHFLAREARPDPLVNNAGTGLKKAAGATSLICWLGITLAGRWTGHLS